MNDHGDYPMTSMPAWRKAVESICRELQWKFRIDKTDDYSMLICPLNSDPNFRGALFIISDTRLALSLSYRAQVPPNLRGETCDAISRLNFGRLAGCFEYEPEHGELRYRDGLFIAGRDADLGFLKTFVATTLQDAISYCADIDAIVAGRPLAPADD